MNITDLSKTFNSRLRILKCYQIVLDKPHRARVVIKTLIKVMIWVSITCHD